MDRILKRRTKLQAKDATGGKAPRVDLATKAEASGSTIKLYFFYSVSLYSLALYKLLTGARFEGILGTEQRFTALSQQLPKFKRTVWQPGTTEALSEECIIWEIWGCSIEKRTQANSKQGGVGRSRFQAMADPTAYPLHSPNLREEEFVAPLTATISGSLFLVPDILLKHLFPFHSTRLSRSLGRSILCLLGTVERLGLPGKSNTLTVLRPICVLETPKADPIALLACRKDFPRTFRFLPSCKDFKLLPLGEVISAPTLFMAFPHFLSEALLLQTLAWCDPSSNFLPGRNL